MPSANKVESDGLVREPIQVYGAELHTLLRDIQHSNVSHLSSFHDRGEVLLAEGEPARGIYLLRTGRATLSIASRDGRVVILRLAQPGDVLGLNSVLGGTVYDMTVKTVESCRADFISRAELMRLMERSDSAGHVILKILSRELTELTERARLLLLPQTVGAKLARLLLEWIPMPDGNNSDAAPIDRVLTQEEIAQMLCTSRETVTRLLASLTRRRILKIGSDSILVLDRAALEAVALD
ncbi:MAG TPA: Crp/Fnr family transcriptional regulator [Pyrinomonadaceae bacterium]|nr:Crp/Fnr family transcriptional regulator [Pyrinomonadaceae bacterium]